MSSYPSGSVAWTDFAAAGLDPSAPLNSLTRVAYTVPVTFTATTSGVLRVQMDNALATPSEDTFRIFNFGAGATPWQVAVGTFAGAVAGTTIGISAAGLVTITRSNAAETFIAWTFNKL